MTYEVELKFPLAAFAPVAARLAELGAVRGATVAQRDFYFNHPSRDFAVTDEALRIRSVGDEHRVTYKGPKLDPQTKTRREIEIVISRAPGDADRFAEMLRLLGFRPVREVVKTRTLYALHFDGRELELALDQVDGLGRFLEIETTADETDRDTARDVILRVAQSLGLHDSERRSYLCLLLERGAGSSS